MKKLSLCLLLALSANLSADVYEGGRASVFRGEITAIENARNSITVLSPENTVKMFHVSGGQINRLQTGQKVTVGYVENYSWPLRTTSVRVGR
jgi:type 1 fimbria pilin